MSISYFLYGIVFLIEADYNNVDELKFIRREKCLDTLFIGHRSKSEN